MPAALLATGCAGGGRDLYENSFSLGFPDPVTDRAEDIYELWLGSVAAAAVVGFAVGALILWTAFRYRRVSDQLPIEHRPTPHNEGYLRTKKERMGHLLHHQGLALDEEMIHEEQQEDRRRAEEAADLYGQGPAPRRISE